MIPDWQTKRAKLWPQEVIRLAQQTEREFGVPACLTLAQWAIESDYGDRAIGKYNTFGIKWPEAKSLVDYLRQHKSKPIAVPTHEYVNGHYIAVKADFVDFPSLEEAFRYHAHILARPSGPYGKCLACIKEWRAYTVCIAKVYATGPEYGRNLLSLILAYHLYDYNLPPAQGPDQKEK